jgi:DNA-binding response OmpR family regulator
MAKILIAEDEQDIRDLIEITLRFVGHEVVSYSNGIEAWKQTVVEKPDLILLDVRMPVMSGIETCLKIKADPRTMHIPVVFLSAKGQDSEIKAGLDAGAVEYILKPFAPEDLNNRLKKIIERSP